MNKPMIDERVVEMRFDNKEFERNTRTTLNTLSRLKEALNFTKSTESLKNLEKVSKDIQLDGIASGIEALENRFSTLGIVGMRVIENITDGLMNSLGKAIHFVTDSIASGGVKRAMNIENAHFQLQMLLKDESKVQAIMSDAMEAVDGTAYAYDEAAKAAAQFAASGIQAGDQMLGALKGITGVAAMTNSDFESISRIFTTVAGNGRLMGDQLLQLSSRGLNAASTLVDYFKEVKKQSNITEATVRDMVSKGKVSFEDFSEAMTWAFGDSAKRANETFTGALSNMKSAFARIGAGFISPLVEQNSELVNLFNALRVQINNVKSALVFDEQKSAVSGLTKQASLLVETMSQFVKSGDIEFESLTKSILTTSKSEEELDELNKKLSESYNKIAESGRLTKETFEEFSQNGVNASKILKDYLNGVIDGSIKASSEVKKLVTEISSGTSVSIADIHKFAESGVISYDLFTNAIVNASDAMVKESKQTDIVISNLMKKVSKSGYLTKELFSEISRNGINTAAALKQYLNGVTEGSIRASYATKQAVEELTQGTKVTISDIHKLADEGKISYAVFQSAMEEMYGDQKLLSKQFTDSFLDTIKSIVTAVQSADLTKPFEAFYYMIEAGKNGLKGLLSVAKPVGKAFADVFLTFSGDDIVDFTAAIEELTAKMKLSEKNSNNLHDAFQGVFSIVKLLTDGVFKLLGVSTSVIEPVDSLTDLMLALAGAMGRGLTKFSEWIRKSTPIKKSFNIITSSIRTMIRWIGDLITSVHKLGSTLFNLPETKNLFDTLVQEAMNLESMATPYIDSFTETLKGFRDWIEEIANSKYDNLMAGDFLKSFIENISELKDFKLSDITRGFDKFLDKLKEFEKFVRSNKGIDTFLNNMEKFFDNLLHAFSAEEIYNKTDTFMEKMGKFIDWIKNNIAPLFSDISIGGIAGAASGFGMVYAIIKVVKAFDKLTGTVKSIKDAIPNLLGEIKNTLVAYQKDLKASTMIKIAGAIAILAGAITLLSFADMDNAWQATLMLTMIGLGLATAVEKLSFALNRGKSVNDNLYQFSKGISKAFNNLAKAAKWAAIGFAFTNFALTIAIVAGAIIALGVMYRKDPAALTAASEMVVTIGLVITGMMAVMAYIGDQVKSGMKNFAVASLGVLALGLSLTMIVRAMKNIMKMEFPNDWKKKFGILSLILVELGALAITMGFASKFMGEGKISSVAFIGLSVMLIAVVHSLDKLFKMELPNDYGQKLMILAGIFIGMIAVVNALGTAGARAGSVIKAGGTILALSALLVVTVGSLMVLSLIPADKMLKGAIALGVILTTLGVALAGAGKVTSPESFKTVLSMTILVAAIAGSLSILSLIPISKLAKSSAALGVMLIAMAYDFKQIAKITDDKALSSIIGMMLIIGEIAGVLFVLSSQPWENLLAAAGAMSLTLTAFANAYQMVLKKDWSKNTPAKMKQFLLLVAATIPIAGELGYLANQPWEGLLAAAGAMSGTMVALASAYFIISKTKAPKTDILVGLGALVVATIPLAIELGVLANQPWEGLLAAATSLSLLLTSLSVVLVICSGIGLLAEPAMIGATILMSFIAVLGGLMLGIGALFNSFEGMGANLDKGIEILTKVGEGLGSFIGAIIKGFSEEVLQVLPLFGESLSGFWNNAEIFFNGISGLSDDVFGKVEMLATSLIALTIAKLINGITSIMGLGLVGFGIQLSAFMLAIKPFFKSLDQVKPESIAAAKEVAEMIVLFTAAKIVNGLSRIFGSNKTLTDFGKELEAFGPHVARFAFFAKSVKKESVEGAAAAAKIMAECAKTLPKTGGMVQKFFGTSKSLSDFAKELVIFGPSIVLFSNIVKDIDPNSVEGAKSAAEIMAELYNKLPTTGGFVQKIFGTTKNLSDFAVELVNFAPALVYFANTVKNVGSAAVEGAAMAAEIIATLADDLPDSNTLWQNWFGGGKMTLSEFGDQLVPFGESIMNFYTAIEGVDTDTLASVIESFKGLVDLANSLNENTGTYLSDFSESLQKIGFDSVDNFISTFIDSEEKAVAAVNALLGYIYTAIDDQKTVFKFRGFSVTIWFLNGITSKYQNAINTGSTLATKVITGITLKYESFKTSGINAGQGFINGLTSMADLAREAGSSIATAALEGMNTSLDINSPSKETAKIADFTGLGFINTLLTFASKAYTQGQNIGRSTMEGLKSELAKLTDEINYSFNEDPTIRPIVDLSDVRKSTDEISQLFNEAINLTKDNVELTGKVVSVREKYVKDRENTKDKRDDSEGGVVKNYNFIQNNTSPKPLSRIDIYRNTRNQFSQFKEAMDKL